MRKKARRLRYRPRSPYTMYLQVTKYEMEGIDDFLELADNTWKAKQKSLEKLANEARDNIPDDWLVDDFAQLGEFADLSAEFAIIGLWRCIERYKARAKRSFRSISRRYSESKSYNSADWDMIR